MVSFDYSVVKHYKFYGFVKRVFGPIFRAVYKLEFRGLENVPQDKNVRYIVAVNHTCLNAEKCASASFYGKGRAF